MSLIKTADKAKFTRMLPLEFKNRWKLGSRFLFQMTLKDPLKKGKQSTKLSIVPTAVYQSIVEYIYKNPITGEKAFGLIPIHEFINKVTFVK